MFARILLLVIFVLTACTPTSITISLGAPTATPTGTPTLPPPTATSTPTPDFTATAQVYATATAQAEATAQARAQATTQAILAEINANATAQARATAATATARANATATAQAATVATRNAMLAFVDALVAKADKPKRFPDGQLTSSQNVLTTYLIYKNFVLDMEFTNPADPKIHPWDLMLMFRLLSQDERYFLVLYSNASWALLSPGARLADRTTTERISSGTLPMMNVSPTGSNKVRFVAYENAGWLFVNGQFAGTMDLSKHRAAGELFVATGMIVGDNFPGLVMPYKNLVVSGLP
mgnify:CR=1 FL=1